MSVARFRWAAAACDDSCHPRRGSRILVCRLFHPQDPQRRQLLPHGICLSIRRRSKSPLSDYCRWTLLSRRWLWLAQALVPCRASLDGRAESPMEPAQIHGVGIRLHPVGDVNEQAGGFVSQLLVMLRRCSYSGLAAEADGKFLAMPGQAGPRPGLRQCDRPGSSCCWATAGHQFARFRGLEGGLENRLERFALLHSRLSDADGFS
jgi:hypothetical protein